MKIFTSEKIWKKIVIMLIAIILFQFSMPKQVQADEDMPIGGKLLEPVLDLVVFLGDRDCKYFASFDYGTIRDINWDRFYHG